MRLINAKDVGASNFPAHLCVQALALPIPKDKQLELAHATIYYTKRYNTPYADVTVALLLGIGQTCEI